MRIMWLLISAVGIEQNLRSNYNIKKQPMNYIATQTKINGTPFLYEFVTLQTFGYTPN